MRTITIVLFSAIAAAFAAMLGVPAHAQYYGGLPLYAVRGTLPADANNLLFGSRFFGVADSLENGGTDLKFGYRFSSHSVSHIALVGQYADANRWSSPAILFGPPRASQRSTSYGLDLVGTLPIFDRLSLTANAGVARVRTHSVFGSAVPIALLNNADDQYTSAGRVGLGVEYDFSHRLGFRFGLERYRNLNGNAYGGSNLDADTFSFGMRIRF